MPEITPKLLLPSLTVALALLLIEPPTVSASPPQSFTIQDAAGTGASLNYQVQPASGQVFLTHVGDVPLPTAFVLDPIDLWKITLREVAAQTYHPLSPSLLTPGSYTFQHSPGSTNFTATWAITNLSAVFPSLSGTASVTVRASIASGDRLVEFTITARVNSLPRTSLYTIEFARFSIHSHGTPATQELALPAFNGRLIPDPLHNTELPSLFDVPGELSMQWIAYYDTSEPPAATARLCFMGTRDLQTQFKTYQVDDQSSPDQLNFSVIQTPSNNFTNTFYDSGATYPVVLGTVRALRSDAWYDAARHYRTWALTTPWGSGGGPLMISPTVRDAKMFARAEPGGPPTPHYCSAMGDATNFQYWNADNSDQLVQLFPAGSPGAPSDFISDVVYQWDKDSFNAHWGDWFPAQSGFSSNVLAVTNAGHRYAFYFNNVILYSDLPQVLPGVNPAKYGSKTLSDFTLKSPTGQLFISPGCQVPGPSIHALCLATTDPSPGFFAKDYVIWAIQQLKAATAPSPVTGIYLDLFNTPESEALCYAADHGHPVGGGNYYFQAKLALLDAVRQELGTNGFIESETVSEVYLQKIDLGFTHLTGLSNYSLTTTDGFLEAPLFETVYHGHMALSASANAINAPYNEYRVFSEPSPSYFFTWLRLTVAATTYFGWTPFAGSILSDPSTGGSITSKITPGSPYYKLEYALFIELVRKYMGLLRQDVVRNAVILGDRLRDPENDAIKATIPTGHTAWYLPYNSTNDPLQQPLVYVAAYRDAVTPPNKIVILLTNWSDPMDSPVLSLPDGKSPGFQTIKYKLSPSEYGLIQGTHTATTMTSTGVQSTTVVVDGTTQNSIGVRAREMVVVVIDP
jgi:uncharacterized protein DUF6259